MSNILLAYISRLWKLIHLILDNIYCKKISAIFRNLKAHFLQMDQKFTSDKHIGGYKLKLKTREENLDVRPSSDKGKEQRIVRKTTQMVREKILQI